ncbi:MAG: peptide chain release factor N(5)-glutamine methyltransferase [Lachnospiraceae bacterium]
MSGGEAVRCAAQYLAAHQIEDADNDAWLLFSYVTHITRAMFLAERWARMDQEALERYEALLVRRAAHIPLQHLTGEQEFMGFPFRVNEHVLVPRQDTEILVEEALKVLAPGDHVLDLCTGSGCIAISLWKLCTGLTVEAADLSAEALAVAKENAKALEAGVAFFRGDLSEAVTGRQMYDCIVSNPPYIRMEVIETLSEEVRAHEPYQALDGKEDGLYFYREIIRKAGAYLKPGGHLLFEIGYDQAEAVSMLMQTQGYEEIEVIQDLAGLDRVVKGKRKQEELHV